MHNRYASGSVCHHIENSMQRIAREGKTTSSRCFPLLSAIQNYYAAVSVHYSNEKSMQRIACVGSLLAAAFANGNDPAVGVFDLAPLNSCKGVVKLLGNLADLAVVDSHDLAAVFKLADR